MRLAPWGLLAIAAGLALVLAGGVLGAAAVGAGVALLVVGVALAATHLARTARPTRGRS